MMQTFLYVDLERLYPNAGNGLCAAPTTKEWWVWTFYGKLAAVETPEGRYVRAEVVPEHVMPRLIAHWRLPEETMRLRRVDDEGWAVLEERWRDNES